MSYAIIIAFDHSREYEILLHADDLKDMNQDQARAWLAGEFEDLECVPSNPTGKILLLDMILNVALYGGEERFEEHGAWAKNFATAVAVLLERPAIKIDVANFVVG